MSSEKRSLKDEAIAEKSELSRPGSAVIESLDARIQRLAQEAPPFYKNRNLLNLYLMMIPGCLVPALTLGFDASMMNGLQAVATWQECE